VLRSTPGLPAAAATLTARVAAEEAIRLRTSFANAFRETVGVTPGAYLQAWRIGIAQELLSGGHPLKHIANEVGYSSEAALSRAFLAHTGESPRAWRLGRSRSLPASPGTEQPCLLG
jgi:AraC-like DNA-binding protein